KNTENYLAQLQRGVGLEGAAQPENAEEHNPIADAMGLPPELLRGLRHAENGEAQVRGLLLRIDCGAQAAKGVIVYIQTQGRTLRLHNDDLREIRFRTYTTEVHGMMTCG